MKRFLYILFISLLAVFLISCKQSASDNTPLDIDLSSLEFNLDTGKIVTSLSEALCVTPFLSSETVDAFVTAPCVCEADNIVYIIRNFPEYALSSPTDIYAFLENNPAAHEIEIYDCLQKTDSSIVLNDISGLHIVFYDIHYSVTDDLFYLIGLQQENSDYIPCVYTVDAQGALLSKHSFSTADISSCIVLNGSLYYKKSPSKLVKYNLSSGNESVICESVVSFTESGDFLSYIEEKYSDDYESSYHLYIHENNKSSYIADINVDVPLVNMAYDHINRVFYYSDGTSLFTYNFSDTTSHKIHTVIDSRSLISKLSDNYLIVQTGHNQVSLYNLKSYVPALPKADYTVRICNITSEPGGTERQFYSALKMLESNGIYVKIEDAYFSPVRDEYSNTLAKKLLAGDTDFDIFFIDSSMYFLLNEGFYEDLSSHKLLNELYSDFIPGVKDICTIGETLALVPTWITIPFIEYSPTMYSELIRMPDSFDDFPQFIAALDNMINGTESYTLSGSYLHSLTRPWFENLLSNYLSGCIDDDIAYTDLCTLLTFCKLLHETSSVYIGTEPNQSIVPLLRVRSSSANIETATGIYPLPIFSNYKQCVSGQFFAINPNSPNKEIAAILLTFYMDFLKTYVPEITSLFGAPSEKISMIIKYSILESVPSDFSTHLYDMLTLLVSDTGSIDDIAQKMMTYFKFLRDE